VLSRAVEERKTSFDRKVGMAKRAEKAGTRRKQTVVGVVRAAHASASAVGTTASALGDVKLKQESVFQLRCGDRSRARRIARDVMIAIAASAAT